MMFFFSTGTGVERVRVVGLDLDGWRIGMQAIGLSGLWYNVAAAGRPALDVILPCKKNRQEEGPARASPVAAPMPKSVSF